jgi:hypothetical protein
LKSGNTIRLGRFTCIPVARPQPAAAEALEELSTDLAIAAVSLRSLSPRELVQNTGLPASEAERIRMRDFDELFFFAGASDSDIAQFAVEAKARGFTLQNLGSFWSFSVGGDYGKCIRELGALYDRALRYHALRVGVAVTPTSETTNAVNSDLRLKSLAAACDRTIFLAEREPSSDSENLDSVGDPEEADEVAEVDEHDSTGEIPIPASQENPERHSANSFPLHSPELWESVLASLLTRR